eukprot:Skav226038  [mRNA]  locus=scaffold2502:166242:172291:- [translate_table: standard]
MAAVEDTEPEDFDDFDDFDDEDYETLPCSFKYVRICLLLPAVNGFLNAFLWPAYSLYFEEMGWPLVRAGIAFDTFGDSETQARQATSTVLSVFTIAFACSCTFGGILYDLGSWTGVAMYHLILQGLMLVLLALEPACRHSFMRVFFADADEEMDLDPENAETKGKKSKGSKDPFEIGDQMFIAVIPDATEIKLPSAVDELQIEEVTGTEDGKREKSQMDTPSVFLSLQVLCRNADAIGGSVAGVLATWLFSLDPAAPFALGTALASVLDRMEQGSKW